jgi:hypothetical protein
MEIGRCKRPQDYQAQKRQRECRLNCESTMCSYIDIFLASSLSPLVLLLLLLLHAAAARRLALLHHSSCVACDPRAFITGTAS